MKKLGLILTKGSSLLSWKESGLYDREIAIYKEYIASNSIEEVTVFSYSSDDICNVKGINLVKKPRIFYGKLGDWLYSFFLPLIHYKTIKGIDVFKSNQMLGSWALVIIKLIYKKHYLLRTGYTLTLFLKKQGVSNFKLNLFGFLEKLSFRFATVATCASEQDKSYLIEKYNFLNDENLFVQKNYIDTNKYYSKEFSEKDDVICFVGRFNKQKNIINLLRAYKDSRISQELLIIGQGELESEIRVLIESLELSEKVKLLGRLSNDEVASCLRSSRYYIISSLYEGMPKTLLEAMASGCFCLATNVDGNNEVIKDSFNGILIDDTSSQSIERALKAYCLTKPQSIDLISANAIDYINKYHSLAAYSQSEYKRLKYVYSYKK